jgi:hypothetical protein
MSQYLEPLWDVRPKYVEDRSTKTYTWLENQSSTDLSSGNNDTNTIKIHINDIDSWMLFSQAHLQLDVTVSADSALTAADGVAILNGFGILKDMNLYLNQKNIDECNHPDIQHHMVHLHKQSRNYADTVGQLSFFYPAGKKDFGGVDPKELVVGAAKSAPQDGAAGTTYLTPVNNAETPSLLRVKVDQAGSNYESDYAIAENPSYDPVLVKARKRIMDNGGKITLWLPLREIFPVLEHALDRVNKGSRFELQFNKQSNYSELFYTAKAVAGLKASITKASVWVPRLVPNIEAETRIMKQLSETSVVRDMYNTYETQENPFEATSTSNTVRLQVSTSRPTMVYVGFMLKAQRDNNNRHPLQFEGLNLDYIEARVNSRSYPLETYTTGLTAKNGLPRQIMDIYHANGKSFEYDDGAIVDYESFANGAHRVYALNMSEMEDDVFKRNGNVDLQIRFELSGNASGAYTMYSTVVTQRELSSQVLESQLKITQS